jgi:hypothetical protein
MPKLALVLALAVALGMVAAPAAGQTLAERVKALQEKRAQKEKATKIRMLQALLYREVTVTFDRTPARDVFDFLRVTLDVNLLVRYSDDAVGYGIEPDTPITLTAEGMPALDVLELVLEQCSLVDECTWQLRRGYVEVGTKERLSVPATREVRWFPIDELVFEAPHFNDAISMRLEDAFPFGGGLGWGYSGGFLGGGGMGGYGGSIRFATPSTTTGNRKQQRIDSLIDMIVETVEPDAWRRNGGTTASIRHHDGALIINAPPYVHRKIFGYPRVPPPEDLPEPVEAPEPPTTQPR